MKIAVVSGKGGSGKSSISAAFVAAAPQVMAIDCDVDCSNLPLLFGHETFYTEKFASGQHLDIDLEKCIRCRACIKHCAFDALNLDGGVLRCNPFLCEGCGFCVRICPVQAIGMVTDEESDIYQSTLDNGILTHGRLKPGDDNSGKMIARLRELADRKMEEDGLPLQILDGPPGIGCPVISTVTGVDRIVIVAEPTLSGISDLQRCHAVCSQFCKDIRAVINKKDLNKEVYQQIKACCKDLDIPVIAELPFAGEMVEAQLHCRDIISYAPQSMPAAILREGFRQLVDLRRQ